MQTEPKLTFKGVTYTYDIIKGKVVNRVLKRDLRALIESELSDYEGIDQKEMDAINEMIYKELQASDIPWEELDEEALLQAFG